MRLSWGEIRARAKAFSDEWTDAHYEKGETQSFYNDFFAIFGVKRRQVAVYEQRVKLLNDKRGFIDLFWPGVLLVEQKSAGLDLRTAQGQALTYFDALREDEQPRFVLTCDFQRFRLLDLDTRTELAFTLPELHKHVEAFAFVLGRRRSFGTQAAVNIKAAELMGRLHDALEESDYRGHDLERLLVRLLFCLFADDTGIFEPKDIFLSLIDQDTREDGSDVGRTLNESFDILDTPESSRQRTIQSELAQFPYINGGLFSGHIRTPVFDQRMRNMLLDAARFDWGKVSPAIFGSLFQSVMDSKERRSKGAHYTSEANILKVIGPLFLDDLRGEFERLRSRRTNRSAILGEFQRKLSKLRFLDPACGCGNFLVVAYRELRRLELDVLTELYGKQTFDLSLLSLVTVDQFYGIEIEEFPARIAEVAMWMTDHIANNELSLAFGQAYARIPLRDEAHIRHADALEIDWNDLLPADECSFVFGNPPFVGFVMRGEKQQSQTSEVLRLLGATGSRLDYVTAWFLKAAAYTFNSKAPIGFVATNSIAQGEQVAALWPALFERWKLEVSFAHRTFEWGSEARGKAHVHVVIVGLCHQGSEPPTKRLFSYPDIRSDPVETQHGSLTAYLFDGKAVANRHLVVRREARSLCAAPPICVGTKPVDGGHLIFDGAARRDFLADEPDARALFRPFLGGFEFINGAERWLLHAQAASPSELRAMPMVAERIALVRQFREHEGGKLSQSLAAKPTEYHVTVIPDEPYLVLPEVSSQRREYVPIGWVEPPTIPSNQLLVVRKATRFHFGVLTSRMHMAWLKHIGGRLKNDFRYSSGLVYNTFPWPDPSLGERATIESLADAVLAARAEWPTSCFADLYDPDTMPMNLRSAHARLDLAVDRLYRREPFKTDRDRVEHLFGRYEALVNPLGHEAARARRRPRLSAVAQS